MKTKTNPNGVTKHQQFEIIRVNRADIKGAPYNPRKITAAAKKKLLANIKKVGLLAPIVVNKSSSLVVSGHQRLACLDALEARENYFLDVSMVELTEKEAREQMLFLNNDAAMGSWDTELLYDLLKDVDTPIDVDFAGFDPMDLEHIFDGTGLAISDLFEASVQPEPLQRGIEAVLEQQTNANMFKKAHLPDQGLTHADPASNAVSSAESYAKAVEEGKALKQKMRTQHDERDDTEIFAVIVFKSRSERGVLMRFFEHEEEARYLDGSKLMALLEKKCVSSK